MVRALLIATLLVMPSCKKEPPGDEGSKPESKSPAFDCGGRVAVADYQSGTHQSHLEIGCDEGPPYIRGTITKNGSEQPMVAKIGAEDFNAVWTALDEAKWTELPEACGAGGAMTLSLSLKSSSASRKYDCKGPISEAHAALVRALEQVAPEQTFKGLEVGEAAKASPLAALEPGMAADKAAIEKLVPGYEVAESESAIEEGMRKIKLFTFSKDGSEVAFARAEKGKVFAVRITEPNFAAAGGKAVLGQPFADTALIKDCYCRGEDGTDGFHCELDGIEGTLVFETVDGDCAFDKPEKARDAVKDRKPTGFQLSAE